MEIEATKTPLRAEGDEDKGGDQVKQGAPDKHGGDLVIHDPACCDFAIA